MLKKHMAACLVATAFAAAPAYAQTATTPSGSTDRPAASGSGSTATGSSAMQPGSGSTMGPATGPAPMTTAPGSSAAPATGSSTMGAAPAASAAPGSSTMAQSGGMQGQFMTQMQGEQMMASSLMGTTVVSTNNESIGDVNDVILDRNGQVLAVVVGVGGFLGIGEKDVAVPFKSLEFASREQATAMSNTAAGGTGTMAPGGTAPGSSVNTTGSTAGATNRSTATTGNTGGNGTSAAPDTAARSGNSPDRVMLRMTKAELQAAPSFRASGGGSSASGSTTAPKP